MHLCTAQEGGPANHRTAGRLQIVHAAKQASGVAGSISISSDFTRFSPLCVLCKKIAMNLDLNNLGFYLAQEEDTGARGGL